MNEKTNPEEFHKQLDAIANGEVFEESTEEENTEEEEHAEAEEADQTEEETTAEEETEEEEELLEKTDKGVMIPKGRFDEINEERLRYKIEFENLEKAVQEYILNNQGGQGEATEEESSEYDPIDPDADNAYKKQLKEMQNRIDALEGNGKENLQIKNKNNQ